MAGNPEQAFPLAGPGLGCGPSGQHVISGIFVPSKRQREGREMGGQPPFGPVNSGNLVSLGWKSSLAVQTRVSEGSLGREKEGCLLGQFSSQFLKSIADRGEPPV